MTAAEMIAHNKESCVFFTKPFYRIARKIFPPSWPLRMWIIPTGETARPASQVLRQTFIAPVRTSASSWR